MFKVVVSEKESGLVIETLTLSFVEAEAVFKGYENDPFYAVEAQYIH
jgi:hypothetical protein